MTGLQAVTAVAVYLNRNQFSIFGEAGGKIYKYEKDETYTGGEYIAVNNLPFPHRYVAQSSTVNINIHVPKNVKTGEPNTKRLGQLVDAVRVLFEYDDGVKLDGAYFRYDSDSRPVLDNDNTYYVNIAIECLYGNQKVITKTN